MGSKSVWQLSVCVLGPAGQCQPPDQVVVVVSADDGPCERPPFPIERRAVRRPDGATCESVTPGIELGDRGMDRPFVIVLPNPLAEAEVPVGSEVWVSPKSVSKTATRS